MFVCFVRFAAEQKVGRHSILPPSKKKKELSQCGPLHCGCQPTNQRHAAGQTKRVWCQPPRKNPPTATAGDSPASLARSEKKLKWRRVATTIWLHCVETWAPLGVRWRRGGKKGKRKKRFREKKGGGIGKVRLPPCDPVKKNAILCWPKVLPPEKKIARDRKKNAPEFEQICEKHDCLHRTIKLISFASISTFDPLPPPTAKT